MLIVDIHTELIGKIAKLSKFGLELEDEYIKLFGFGNKSLALSLFEYQETGLKLMFMNEPVIKKGGLYWFCLKEVGKNSDDTFHWYTLEQLIICTIQ